MAYDVIIKNGTVFDGKGNKPEIFDVGIYGDEIKKIGDLKNEQANEIIDASGKFVAPGFIDLTNHSDTHWILFTDPSQENLIRQGITTILGGNCGSSLAPFSGESSVKEIRRWVDASKINVNWQTTGEFLSELENHGVAVNFCTLTGLNTLQKISNEQNLEQIKFILKQTLEEGSFGISANFGVLTDGKDFNEDEIIELFKVVGEHEAITKHHLEDEGENILPAISRLLIISRKSGAKIHISHLKALGRKSWKFFPDAIKMLKTARNEGLKTTCDFFPYTRTGSNLFMLLPSWLRKLPRDEILSILLSKEDKRRKDAVDFLKELTLHYDKIIIASAAKGLSVTGKTIKYLSEFSSLTEEEIVFNLLATSDLRVSIFNEVISEENIKLIALEDFAAVSSDGMGYSISNPSEDLPHPRSFGAFPRAINLFVKEGKILSWENIIYKMTGLPAGILGIKDRGTLAKGKKADIIIFDQNEISDYATYDNPFQYSRGMKYVFINGIKILNNEEFVENFPGYVLRKK